MLSLLPLDTPDQCNCCTDPLLLRWHGMARKMDVPVSLDTLRDDGVYGEDGEDAFLDDELAIAAALAAAWAVALNGVKGKILAVFDKSFSNQNLQIALDDASSVMGNVYERAAPEVEAAIRSTLQTGVGVLGDATSGALPILRTPSAQSFEKALIAATRYSTNRFFNTQIVPSIIRAVDAAFHQIDAPDLAAIQELIAVHFRTVPYWQLVANVAASRGYHYGYLRSMQSRGVIGYRFVAVIDRRTSSICRSLNGKEFLVSEAINLLDGLAEDPDPLAGKRRTPWVKESDVEGKSSQELAAMGVMVPPLHPRCRSTIQPIY